MDEILLIGYEYQLTGHFAFPFFLLLCERCLVALGTAVMSRAVSSGKKTSDDGCPHASRR